MGSGAPPPMRNALTDLVAPGGAGIHDVIRYAIERGADVNARDAKGRTVAMLAASSEALSPESMSLLIARGADVNVRDGHGVTVLDPRSNPDTPPWWTHSSPPGEPGTPARRSAAVVCPEQRHR